MYYFSYGTNKDERAMARRAPKATVVGDAVPRGFLCFVPNRYRGSVWEFGGVT